MYFAGLVRQPKGLSNKSNDYIAWRKEEGTEPEKPYSGKFNVGLSPELHRQIALISKKMRMSLNSFVEKAITDEIFLLNEIG